MINIDLSQVPNQSLSITLENNNWDIRLRSSKNIISVDFYKNNDLIISGVRANPNYLLIPYRYLSLGNFIIATLNEEYPDYTLFGVTQTMIYFTESEMEAIYAGNRP